MNNTQAIVYNIREVIKLKEINAELLEALKQIVEYENQFNLYFDKSAGNDADMRAIARKAIAKAKS